MNWSCTPGAQGGCYHYDYGNDGTVDAGITYSQIANSRDAFAVWMGLTLGVQGWSWDSDIGAVQDFPDEMGADITANEVDEDIDGDGFNNTIDIIEKRVAALAELAEKNLDKAALKEALSKLGAQ